jgi:outer membrane protein OmpA-like peptidoglycan-associated protein
MDRELRRAAAALAAWGLAACLAAAQAAQAVPAAGTASTRPMAGPYRLAFSHVKGDKFRVLSRVNEDVYLDGRLTFTAEILNRIAMTVADAAPDGSWGLLSGSFETSERGTGSAAYVISESYASEFKRDRLGRYEIDPKYFMPVVRDVPAFPDRPLAIGDTWTAPGSEKHDFRPIGIPDPYTFPIDVRYRLDGPVDRSGRSLLAIKASYTIFERPARPRAYATAYPVQIAGYSDQTIYWDESIGQPAAYEERFDLVFDWSDGSTREYRGTAGSDLVVAAAMDRGAIKAEVEKAVSGLPNVTVRDDAEGVTISIEDIQFEPDSAALKPGELPKIARIAEALKRYPDRDVLVSGHAAKAGFAEGRQPLSEARARSVAERLIALGARSADRIRATGYGDSRPIADNATEAGRARNRRVEVTILEN